MKKLWYKFLLWNYNLDLKSLDALETADCRSYKKERVIVRTKMNSVQRKLDSQ
jgi:hypothetical protein